MNLTCLGRLHWRRSSITTSSLTSPTFLSLMRSVLWAGNQTLAWHSIYSNSRRLIISANTGRNHHNVEEKTLDYLLFQSDNQHRNWSWNQRWKTKVCQTETGQIARFWFGDWRGKSFCHWWRSQEQPCLQVSLFNINANDQNQNLEMQASLRSMW